MPTIKTQLHNNVEYKVCEGLFFKSCTSDQLVNIITYLYLTKDKVRLYYGNNETGEVSLDEYDLYGTIGKSTGIIKVPLLIPKINSISGSAISTSLIVGIARTKDKKFVYKANNFKLPVLKLSKSSVEGFTHEVSVLKGNSYEVTARFRSLKSAERYMKLFS